MKKKFILLLALSIVLNARAQHVVFKKEPGAFSVVAAGSATTILVDNREDSLVQIAANLFRKDVEIVSGKKPAVVSDRRAEKNIIVIGSIGKSQIIGQLATQKKLDIDKLRNKWEAYQIQVIKAPYAGVDNALVIVGSDRRGTAFGVLELSKQMGVSPWYWWADVPVKHQEEIYVKQNTLLVDAPKVKYRGIFINDEAPALSGWSKEKFGGFNHSFYEKVFELMLRLKANYLWPAMWGSAFYDDDSLNKQTADSYGIVIGTSHHEPLMRAHDEWRRYGEGKWNYDSNEVRLKKFWKGGMQRATNEKIVSIGMRGDGDEPMSRETATALLERIVKDQRKIIEDVTGKPASQTPQLWALYKEVQDYYDKGMRVPDDVTLLLCDDNWGNIRKLPKLNEPPRKGGYGIYYHFDYVGGPRNYKWINTNNIARVWEQMHLAWEYNAREIWIVNVGDIKPMEFPISFFLENAWNPTKWNQDNLRDYYTAWAAQQFGSSYAKEIGEIIRKYSQYAARKKPELVDANTYSIHYYDEARKVASDYNALLAQATKISNELEPNNRDAFFQLVLHPVKALATLQNMYVATAYNRWFASQKWQVANKQADKVRQLYEADSMLTLQYHSIANGKWNHMMDQTHIGYTYWQQPPVNKMPEVKYVTADSAQEQATKITGKSVTAEELVPAGTKASFYEKDGYVSIEAEHWTRAVHSDKIQWKVIPDIGRTGSGISTFPVTIATTLSATSPHVEYEFYSYTSGQCSINIYCSPTLNFHNDQGLQFAISVDDEQPQIITLNKDDNNTRVWEKWVADNIIIKTSKHNTNHAGKHLLKYWMISPAVVLQKLVIDFGGLKPTYLGPDETKKK